MRFPRRSPQSLFVLFALNLFACSSVTPPPPAAQPSGGGSFVSTPLFSPDSSEAKAVRAFAREQDGRLSTCGHDQSCDRAHFTRALLFLSENQDLAAKHFQEVVAISSKSPLGSLSTSWLKLLKEPSMKRQITLFAQTTQWLFQDLWSREQVFKDELGSRDKKLEALAAQLEALKQIDLELAEKAHPMRPKTKVNQPPYPPN